MTRRERELAAAEELCLRCADLICRVIHLSGDAKTDEERDTLNDACRALDKLRARIDRTVRDS